MAFYTWRAIGLARLGKGALVFLWQLVTFVHPKFRNQISRVMRFFLDKQERYTLMKIQEENLNAALAPQLKSELVVLANEGVPNLIIDLSEVKYVDSSGLSAILTADRLWKSGTFVLTGVQSDAVRKLIEISRLDTVLRIIPTVEESIDFVFMEEIERQLKNEQED